MLWHYIKESFKRGAIQMVRRPMYFLMMVIVPIFGAWVLMDLMDDGGIRRVPVAVIDQDNSELSRQLLRTLDGFPQVHITHRCKDFAEARQLVQSGEVYGFYYIQTQAPSDTTTIDRDATVYINYTGMLLNGDVFDTSISEVAKDAGIYSSSKSYTPMTVTLNEDYEEITTTTSSGSTGSLVKGFSYCVSLMKTGEKGTCIFYSDLGYEASAQDKIPAYSPLRFDIEMIGTENN